MQVQRPSAQEFVRALLETVEDLPDDFVRRFEEVVAKEDVERSQAIRQLFEEFAGE
jgi:metal-responsive CopG/Arc/MetJ family transcriptional regulator